MTKSAVCALGLFACVALLCAVAGAAEPVPRFGVFETTLTGPGKLDDPYRQVSVSVTFTGPVSAKSPTIVIDAFWDGGATWRVRMSPTEVGQWTWRTNSETKELNNLTGKFPCTPSTGTPFLRVAPAKPIIMHGDKPLYLLGCTGSALSDFSLKDGSFQKFIDARASQGFNFLLYHGGFTPLTLNETGMAFSDPKRLTPNPAFFQAADQRMYYCRMKGVVPVVSMQFPAVKKEDFVATSRYVVARYAAFDVIWAFFPEESSSMGDSALIRKFDPYTHPVMETFSPTAGAETVPASVNIIFATNDNSAQLSRLFSFGRPVVNELPLIENATGKEGAVTKDLTAGVDVIRRLAWTSALCGAYPVYRVAGVDPAKPETMSSPAAQQVAALGQFFRQADWLSMTPSQDILLKGDALVLAKPGPEYVVYLPKGGSITLDLSAAKESKLRIQWFDPRTGKVKSSSEQAAQKELTLQAPDDKDDWVLYLSRVRPVPER